jgi:hypothetical protein
MKITRMEMLALLGGVTIANPAHGDNTGTISIVGKADIDGNRRTVGITLVLKDKIWSKSEPGECEFLLHNGEGQIQRSTGSQYTRITPNECKCERRAVGGLESCHREEGRQRSGERHVQRKTCDFRLEGCLG